MKPLFENYHSSELIQSSRYINTPSEFAKKNLFYVQETGYLKSIKSHLSKRSRLSSFLFIVVLSGQGEFTYKDQIYFVEKGQCIFIDCQETYSHQSNQEDPWELLWVHFHGLQAEGYFHYFETQNDYIFNPVGTSDYIHLIRCLIDATKEKGRFYELTASKYLTDLVTISITGSSESARENNEPLSGKLNSIKNYLDEHFNEKIFLDELVEHFYISKFHLSREFKRNFGMTIVDYITIRRINKAKEFLRFSGKTIEIIAQECGYPDASYFNKVFQKTEGTTATEYRKRWRG